LLVREVFRTIAGIRDEGTTILLVEQNANKALQLADYAYVLDHGLITRHGTGQALRQDPQIVESYLGSH
ncbi:MAG: ABC transporter ATP-binding protein, partial [Anaerolineae bacterium]